MLANLERPSAEDITVTLMSWNDKTTTFDLNSRMVPKKLLIDTVTTTLGGRPESIESIDDDQANQLVKSIADLVERGHS